MESMSPIKPIRSFSVAILKQPVLATAKVENNNRSNSIKPVMKIDKQ